jgi:lysine-specific permease
MISTFIIAGFSFQGTELVGITAAESADPDRSIPTAIRQVFWRILIFYVFSIAVVGALICYDNPNLLGAADHGDVTKSPFTIVLEQAGIPMAKDIMNAVILSSIISVANSATYSSSRMLYSLSLNGKAPRVFERTLKSGIPFFALCGTSTVCVLLYFLNLAANGVYTTLIKASSLAGFANWFTIAISHYRFRKGFVYQGFDVAKKYYRALFFPFVPFFVMTACIAILVSSNLNAMRQGDWQAVLISYMSIFLFAILYVGYKLIKKTKIVPYDTMFEGVDLHRIEDNEDAQMDNCRDPLIEEESGPAPQGKSL